MNMLSRVKLGLLKRCCSASRLEESHHQGKLLLSLIFLNTHTHKTYKLTNTKKKKKKKKKKTKEL